MRSAVGHFPQILPCWELPLLFFRQGRAKGLDWGPQGWERCGGGVLIVTTLTTALNP